MISRDVDEVRSVGAREFGEDGAKSCVSLVGVADELFAALEVDDGGGVDHDVGLDAVEAFDQELVVGQIEIEVGVGAGGAVELIGVVVSKDFAHCLPEHAVRAQQ